LSTAYALHLPDYFDAYSAEIIAKGYFADATIETSAATFRPTFYDPIRFGQECIDHFAAGAAQWSEGNVVIVPNTSRAAIEAAVAELARFGFSTLTVETRPA
jgi:hypothetical protein